MSMLEQLPEDLRRYRDLKDEVTALESQIKPLREQIIDGMIALKAVSKDEAYRVPGVTVECPDCIDYHPCSTCKGSYYVDKEPLKAYISPTTRESISVSEARFLLDTPTQTKLIKNTESLVLRVEEDKTTEEGSTP